MKLILDDEFTTFNLSLWRHQITMGGGGNWEFEVYGNNRSNSYVRDGVLNIKPTLMADDIGKLSLTLPLHTHFTLPPPPTHTHR